MIVSSPRRPLGDLSLPAWVVQAIAWSMLGLALLLPSIAWEFGWVRPPERGYGRAEQILRDSRASATGAETTQPTPSPEDDPAVSADSMVADCPDSPLPTGELVDTGRTALAATKAPMSFVRLSDGSFTMGSDRGWKNEKPCHIVALDSFEISTHEVTYEQWSLVTKKKPPCKNFCEAGEPVTGVSWLEAIDFLNRLSARDGLPVCYTRDRSGRVVWKTHCTGYRLPTEAEWEYAARAGTTTAFSSGAVLPNRLRERGEHAPAGAVPPNAWGLHNMHGNVSEWVWDAYSTYPPEPAHNPRGLDNTGPTGLTATRVIRGGSFIDPAHRRRAAIRLKEGPRARLAEVGFRAARTPSLPDALSSRDPETDEIDAQQRALVKPNRRP